MAGAGSITTTSPRGSSSVAYVFSQHMPIAEFGDERDGKTRDFLDRFSPLDAVGKNPEAIFSSSPVLLLGKVGKLVEAFRAKKKTAWVLKETTSSKTVKEEHQFLAAASFLIKHVLPSPSH